VDYNKDYDWNQWNMCAKRRILMEANHHTTPPMAPFFVEHESMGSDAATWVSSLASKTTDSYPTSVKGNTPAKKSKVLSKVNSEYEIDENGKTIEESLDGMYKDNNNSLETWDWSPVDHDVEKVTDKSSEQVDVLVQDNCFDTQSIDGADQQQITSESKDCITELVHQISDPVEDRLKKKV
jgi:hypothetical protein